MWVNVTERVEALAIRVCQEMARDRYSHAEARGVVQRVEQRIDASWVAWQDRTGLRHDL